MHALDRSSLTLANETRASIVIVALLAALMASSCGARRPPKAFTPKIGAKEKGMASWYGHPYHGRRTASGEVFDMEKLTAAHRRFAFGTWVRVDNLDNGQRTEVRITDRGPFVRGRIIDLSRAAARDIDMLRSGIARVQLTVIDLPRPKSRSDDRRTAFPVQVAAYRERAIADAAARQVEPALGIARVEEGAGWFRVLVGAAASPEEADQLRRRLADRYPDAFVTRRAALDGQP